MATVALIQRLFRVLTYPTPDELHGLQAQIWENFYESLEEAYNHDLQVAKSLSNYQEKDHAAPDVVIFTPFAEEGNPAHGMEEIQVFKDTFPGIPLIVWSTRTEQSIQNTCLNDLGCAAYYTGTLLDAPEELPDIIANVLAQS